MNFIISRFSKDNFWNIAVYFGILLTVFVAEQYESVLLFVIAFTIVPYILTRFNKVRYLKDGTCVNSQGEDLSGRAPRFIFVIIVLNIILMAFLNAYGYFGFLSNVPQCCTLAVFTGCIIFWPFAYFIFKNCPISALLNADSWQISRAASASHASDPTLRHRPMTSSHDHSSSRNDFITSPTYSHLPQNVYHSIHNRRY